ncbi:MAG: LUD domain-containing protein [Verrucomicrobiae bacterium]|nr:LUD domain-containing protein [Verrucomicrobiae bacterium]
MSTVLDNVRSALAARKEKAPYPAWEDAEVVSTPKLAQGSLVDCFSANMKAVSGLVMHSVAEVEQFLAQGHHLHGYCAPELAEVIGTKLGAGITFSTDFDEACYDDYTFGITRATAAIAESGTIVLNDRDTSCRLGALTPWVHIAVVEAATIHRTLGAAIAALGDDPNTIWVTGPSKTADVEGILIQGVHGPGIQIALIV